MSVAENWGAAQQSRPPRTCRAYSPAELRNYAYVFGLDAGARRRLAEMHDGGKPYPHRAAITTGGP